MPIDARCIYDQRHLPSPSSHGYNPLMRLAAPSRYVAPLLHCGALPLALSGQVPVHDAIRVPRTEIQALMAAEAEKGYNLLVTTTATRMSTAVILSLARAAHAERPDGPPLLLHHEDWYAAYQAVTGLAAEDIPTFVQLQLDFGQDQIIDYRAEATSHEVKKGRPSLFVVRVTAQWPDGPNVADRYMFTDTVPNPDMRVVNEQLVSYYLHDFGDMIVQDAIQGIAGRPTQGALGTLFNVIGDGRAVQSRFTVVDTMMVTYATAKKGFIRVRPVTTTLPDGSVLKDTPPQRPDLEAVAERLKQPIEFKYHN